MAEIRATTPLLPSVFDRLLDDEPDVKREPARSRHQVLRELKLAVRRDLELLLNTRARCIPLPPELDALERSVLTYGIPDFAGANMGSAEFREQFRATIQTIIQRFESRFKSVEVTLHDNEDAGDRTLRFRIDGLLIADPAPEPVVFDSALELETTSVQVKGDR